MGKRKTKEEVEKMILDTKGEDYEMIGEYINMSTKVEVKHKTCGHIYKVRVKDMIYRNSGCPECFGTPKKTTNEFKKELFEVWENEYTLVGEYDGVKNKIKIKHTKCDFELLILPNSILRNHGCPVCSGNKKRTQEEMEKETIELTNCEYEFIGEYKNIMTKSLFKHLECGHEYMVKPNSFLNGARCPLCYGTPKKTTEQYKEDVYKLVGDEYTVLGEYKKNSVKITMKHNICGHEWDIRPNSFLRRDRCPICSLGKSKGERAVINYFNENKINFIDEFCIKKRIRKSKRFDFKVENIIIEFDGRQHFLQDKFRFKSILEKQKLNDRQKNNLALFNGYKLVRISYTEIKNVNKILDEVFSKGDSLEDLSLYGKEYDDYDC